MSYSLEQSNDNDIPAIGIEQAGKMFDTLFLNPENKETVAHLFEGLLWLRREQEVHNAIRASKNL